MRPEENCPEKKFDKLLVATDRTIFSEGAVTEAINFARQCSSFLYILTVLEENPAYKILGEEHRQKKEREAREYLESLKTQAAEDDVVCETVLRHGDDAAGIILEEAAGKAADMIVVGRHGRTEVEKLIMGSVSSAVIAGAPCKVLVAAIGTRIEYRNILVATDGSEHAEAAVSEALEIAAKCKSGLLVVSVIDAKSELPAARELVGRIAGQAAEAGIAVETMTPTGPEPEEIIKIAHNRNVDLIIMGTFGKSRLRQMLMGDTTEKVIRLAHCAVLVVNPKISRGDPAESASVPEGRHSHA